MTNNRTNMTENESEAPGFGWTASEEEISIYFVIFLTLLSLVILLSKWLKSKSALSAILPEAGMVLIVGIIFGSLFDILMGEDKKGARSRSNDTYDDDSPITDAYEQALSFDSTFFFLIFLPPIIFNSGYRIQRQLLLKHITPILLFSCVGTTVSAISIAFLLYSVMQFGLVGGHKPYSIAELLTFGGLISATDPVSTLAVFETKRVDPQLFMLVFGESVLNDAVGLVLFNSFGKFVGNEDTYFDQVAIAIFAFLIDFLYIFGGSFFLGMASGFLIGLLLKCADMRLYPTLELSLYMLIMYFPFFIADMIGLSGIVTILFTGIFSKSYAEPNVSNETKQNADSLFKVTAHLAETCIFLEMGLSVFGLITQLSWKYYSILIAWAFLGCLLGRAIFIYPFSWAYNQYIFKVSHLRRTKSSYQHRGHHNSNSGQKRVTTKRKQSEESKTGSAAQLYTNLDEHGESHSETSVSEAQQLNEFVSETYIPSKLQHMLFYSGLRGAVAYACAKSFPNDLGHRNTFVIVTISIVLLTVFIFGSTTDLLLRFLNIDVNIDEHLYLRRECEWYSLLQSFEEKFIFPLVLRDMNGENHDDNHVNGDYEMSLPLSPRDNLQIFDNDGRSHTNGTHAQNQNDFKKENLQDKYIDVSTLKAELTAREHEQQHQQYSPKKLKSSPNPKKHQHSVSQVSPKKRSTPDKQSRLFSH